MSSDITTIKNVYDLDYVPYVLEEEIVEFMFTLHRTSSNFVLTKLYRIVGRNLNAFDFSVGGEHYNIIVDRSFQVKPQFAVYGDYDHCFDSARTFVSLQWPDACYNSREAEHKKMRVGFDEFNFRSGADFCRVYYFYNFSCVVESTV